MLGRAFQSVVQMADEAFARLLRELGIDPSQFRFGPELAGATAGAGGGRAGGLGKAGAAELGQQSMQMSAIKSAGKHGTARTVTEYGISKKLSRGIERHEVLQHAWLRLAGIVEGKGRWATNTIIELTRKQHRKVSELQKARGLHKPGELAKLSAWEVIERNIEILEEVGVDPKTIARILDDVSEILLGLEAKGARAF
jgi:hypothetical protein